MSDLIDVILPTDQNIDILTYLGVSVLNDVGDGILEVVVIQGVSLRVGDTFVLPLSGASLPSISLRNTTEEPRFHVQLNQPSRSLKSGGKRQRRGNKKLYRHR